MKTEEKFLDMNLLEIEVVNGGSVVGGIAAIGAGTAASAAIVGGVSSLTVPLGIVLACCPAAIVVAVAGAAIGGYMIGEGLVKGEIV